MKSLTDYILERKVITFGSADVNYGQCVILAGGAGSGKGYINNKIMLDAKTIDVDSLKTKYIEMAKAGKLQEPDNNEYSLLNPSDVSKLHIEVAKRKWKQKQRSFLASGISSSNKNGDTSKLPNIIWDMVCKDIDDIQDIIDLVKPLGYKITIVWVVCNVETARCGNFIRDRKVDKKVIDDTHAGARKTLTGLLSGKYPEVEQNIDNIWIGLSAGYGRMLKPEYKNNSVIRVKHGIDGQLDYPASMIDKFLNEQQPYNYEAIVNRLNSSNAKDREQAEKFIDYEKISKDELKQYGDVKEGEYDDFNYAAWDEFLKSIGRK